MDNNIQNKFIMNVLNVDDKDIESLDCVYWLWMILD